MRLTARSQTDDCTSDDKGDQCRLLLALPLSDTGNFRPPAVADANPQTILAQLVDSKPIGLPPINSAKIPPLNILSTLHRHSTCEVPLDDASRP